MSYFSFFVSLLICLTGFSIPAYSAEAPRWLRKTLLASENECARLADLEKLISDHQPSFKVQSQDQEFIEKLKVLKLLFQDLLTDNQSLFNRPFMFWLTSRSTDRHQALQEVLIGLETVAQKLPFLVVHVDIQEMFRIKNQGIAIENLYSGAFSRMVLDDPQVVEAINESPSSVTVLIIEGIEAFAKDFAMNENSQNRWKHDYHQDVTEGFRTTLASHKSDKKLFILTHFSGFEDPDLESIFQGSIDDFQRIGPTHYLP